MISHCVVSLFGADHVDRHRVPENSPAVSGLLNFYDGEMIILFRVGGLPDNGISNGLQGEVVKNRSRCFPIMVTF
jgi:hypothetical protein